MAIQILPIVKAVVPYIAEVAKVAIPSFTSKPEAVKADPVISRQIEELQTAATQNAQSIQMLAEQLRQAIQDIEVAAQGARKQIAAYKTLILCSIALSVFSIAIAVYLLNTRIG